MLSQAGKEVLIKAMAQSIPTYTMSVFQLPMILCDELDTMCAKFSPGWECEENSQEKLGKVDTLEERWWKGFSRSKGF